MIPIKHTVGFGLLAVSVLQPALLIADEPTRWQQVEARVSSILDNMNQSQKINFTRVDDGRMIPSLPEWGIEGTVAYDASMGVHVNDATFGAQYPAQSGLAATWSIQRAQEFGLAIGYETRIAGGQQMLSPTVNLYRTPFGGRNAEFVSGEDPFLGSVLAPAIVNGIQAQGIQASGKHYLANEQEANRQNVNIIADQRTLRELYLPPFESMVKNADIASIMCGFNKINDHYACENHHLITEILKGEWGFQGNVMSDFNSIHDAFKGAWAGTDIDMPSGLQFNEQKLLPYIWSGQLHQSVIDDKVKRNLRAIVNYDFQENLNTAQPLDHPEYGITAALNMAREAIVLLRNENTVDGQPLLPLDPAANIAVIGDMAYQPPASPFGTSNAKPNDYVTEMDGLQHLAESPANVTYLTSMGLDPETSVWYQPSSDEDDSGSPGVQAEFFSNADLSGSPAVTRVEPGVNFNWLTQQNITEQASSSLADTDIDTTPGSFSARFTSTIKPTISGDHAFKVRMDGAVKLWIDDELVLENDGEPYSSDVVNALTSSVKVPDLEAGEEYTVRLEYRRLSDSFMPVLGSLKGLQLSWASLAPPENLADYDAVVVAVGTNYEDEGEGSDIAYALPDQQGTMVERVAQANPNTIVVMHGGGVSDMQPWADQVGATLHAWFPGQQGGQAVAEILYGQVNPSGKLPISIDKAIENNPSYPYYSDPAAYRGENALVDMEYGEGLYLGYRGYDQKREEPLYPFGFGLSYTTFEYSDLSLSSNVMTPGNTVNAEFTLTNTGDMAGFEVAQLYVEPIEPQVDRPEKELKGFTKVYLEPGESRAVSIPLNARSLSYYVDETASWDVDAGAFTIRVGQDSAHLPLQSTLTTLMPERLTTRDSNPLPSPVRDAVQISASQAY
ncbi:glycoside hydrolase family 3 protein [Vreelandella sp. GE22]